MPPKDSEIVVSQKLGQELEIVYTMERITYIALVPLCSVVGAHLLHV